MNVLPTIERHVNGYVVIGVLAAYYGLFVLLYISPLSTVILGNISMDQVPDLQQSGYTIEQVRKFFVSIEESGRSLYLRNLWTIDLIMPFLSAAGTILLMIFCVSRIGSARRWTSLLIVLPIGALGFDYLENIAMTISAASFPNELSEVVRVASIFTRLKWVCISGGMLVSLLLVALLLITAAVRKRAHRCS